MAPPTLPVTVGFPRIGPKRELKMALESFWAGKSTADELTAVWHDVEKRAWTACAQGGAQRVALDSTLYDQVLDAISWLGLTPERFQHLPAGSLERYFALARGAVPDVPALDMSKWLDTNYHYGVPELSLNPPATAPAFDPSPLVAKLARGQAAVGAEAAVPTLVGPVSVVLLAKCTSADGSSTAAPADDAAWVAGWVKALIPAYEAAIAAFAQAGAKEVQLAEPALATDRGASAAGRAAYEAAYAALGAAASKAGLILDLVAQYDDLGEAGFKLATSLPVGALTLDLCGVPGAAAPNGTVALLRAHGFAACAEGKVRLGLGLIDGRSPWRDDEAACAAVVAEVRAILGDAAQLAVTSSVSLQHLPYDVEAEREGAAKAAANDANAVTLALLPRLSFAVQKVAAIAAVAKAADVTPAGPATKAAADAFNAQPREALEGAGLDLSDRKLFERPAEYPARVKAAADADAANGAPALPLFPTSTIGSFPQTAEVRRLRAQLRLGKLSQADYDAAIAAHVGFAVGAQEALGLDVLVHGESERTDMSEFFGTKLDGLAFTRLGWVQSYGSRCVRPPLVVGDVAWRGAMTVKEYQAAADVAVGGAKAGRPVKGMLTGPVTILNWSFPRKDVGRRTQALQLAAALRSEVAALEEAGCRVVQVDEPALREGLPLRRNKWDSYLSWAVDAFKLATAVAAPATSVVTHLCYSEFADILPSVAAMDADVLTIENSRSGDEMVRALAAAKYPRAIAPGVYDVHSPLVPSADAMARRIAGFVVRSGLAVEQVQVVPDCGLKTRAWSSVLPALRNMVAAAEACREAYKASGVKGLEAVASEGLAGAISAAGAKNADLKQTAVLIGLAAGSKPVEAAVGGAAKGCGAGGCC